MTNRCPLPATIAVHYDLAGHDQRVPYCERHGASFVRAMKLIGTPIRTELIVTREACTAHEPPVDVPRPPGGMFA